jgi:hypothetical protein
MPTRIEPLGFQGAARARSIQAAAPGGQHPEPGLDERRWGDILRFAHHRGQTVASIWLARMAAPGAPRSRLIRTHRSRPSSSSLSSIRPRRRAASRSAFAPNWRISRVAARQVSRSESISSGDDMRRPGRRGRPPARPGADFAGADGLAHAPLPLVFPLRLVLRFGPVVQRRALSPPMHTGTRSSSSYRFPSA